MDYIRVNRLRVKPLYSTSVIQPYAVQLGYDKKYRLTKGNTVVWDVLRTTFNAYDFTIGAEGGYVPNYSSVNSYGVNYLNQIEYLDWDCDTYWIDENTSTSPVTHYITYTQEGTGEKVTVICTQEGKLQDVTPTGYRYEAVVTKEEIGKAPATNNYTTLSLKVSGTVYIYEQYSDDTESYYGKQDFSSVTAYVYDGSSTTGAYCATGNVIVPPVGTTTYTGDRVAFTITKYYFDVLEESFYETTSKDVYQAENKITGQEWGTSSSDYSLSISSSASSFTSNGGTATITVQCQQRYRDVYTSLSKGEWKWGNGTASISTSYGSLNKSSITGSGTATLTVGKDYGTGTTAVVTANAGNGTKTATVSVTQAKRVAKETVYNQPTVTSTSIGKASVKGSTLSLSVSWSQTTTIKYDNNTTGEGTDRNGTSVATITNGSSNIGAKIVNGKIEVPNAGTAYYTSDRVAFTITEYSFVANGVTAKIPSSIVVKQEANTRTETFEYYVGLISQSAASVGNAGGTFTFIAESLVRTKYTYATTQTSYSGYSNYSASVTYSNGVTKVSSSTISGKQTITVTVGSNYDSARTPKVVVTSLGDSSKSISITVTQAAAVYDFYFVDPGTIDAYGGTYDITLISKVNGSFMTVIPESVKLSGGTVNKITENASGSKYNVNVTFPANSSTTNTASYVILAQQMNTGKTTSLTIIQAKKTSSYVTGYVSISSLVSGLYVSSDGILGGFNQYPTFTITASSNGWVNNCKYIFCLDFEIQLNNGQIFNPRYEHQLDYIEFSAFSGTKTVRFINFPANFNLLDLTDYLFNPYYSSVVSIRIIADIQPVTGNSGSLMLSQNYTWTVN